MAAAWLEALVGTAGAGERILRGEMEVAAPIEQVYAAWTTDAGGAEGARLLVLEPPTRIAFTWVAPPDLPRIRGQRTIVYLDLSRVDERRTRLRFTHLGWGTGGDWDKAYEYFDRAWDAVVLPRLRERFARGPIDWARVPKLAPVAPSLKAELSDVP